MATVKRIQPGESYGEGAIPSNATIRFEVLGALKASEAIMAVKDDVANGIAVGDIHPDVPGSRLQATRFRAVERIGAGNDRGWYIDVEFGVDGTGANFEEPPVTEPEYVTVEYDSLSKDFQAPYWYREPLAREVGGSIVTTYDWKEQFRKFKLNGESLRIVVNVPRSQYLFGASDLSRAQIDNIHEIGTTKYQYIGYTSTQVAIDVWQVVHEWWSDPGNDAVPLPPGLNPAESVASPSRDPFDDYESYKVPLLAPGTGPIFLPVIETTTVFVEDLNGYNVLLGDPVGRAEAEL